MRELQIHLAFLRKEHLDVSRRKTAIALYIAMPLLLSLVPLVVSLAFRHAMATGGRGPADPIHVLAAAAAATPDLAGLPPIDAVTLLVLRQSAAFLVLVPMVLTSFAGATSIVGEKTERTLEPLLASPLSDRQILTGKLVALGLPAVVATLTGAIVSAAIIDIALYPSFRRLVLPDPYWSFTLVFLVPMAALLSLLVTIRISSRVNDAQSAQQLSGLLALPVMAVVVSGLLKPLAFGIGSLALLAGLFLVGNAILMVYMLARFNREEILTRWR